VEKFNELPLHRKIVLGTGAGLFIAYFLPWVSVGVPGFRASVSAWYGIGVLGGIVLIAVLAWEGLRLAGSAPDLNLKPDLLTAGLAGLAAVLSLIQFFNAMGALGFGAILGLIFLLGLAYGAFLSFQAASKDEGAAGPEGDVTPPGGDVPPPGGDVPPPEGDTPGGPAGPLWPRWPSEATPGLGP
jgi:hypothetical protein